jgi:hypothetical protein
MAKVDDIPETLPEAIDAVRAIVEQFDAAQPWQGTAPNST